MARSLDRVLFRPALALLAVVASAGCISVVADGADMEVTHYGLEFEGTPPAPSGDATSATSSFTHSHSPFDAPGDVDGEIRATSVRLVARPGTPDLSFIRRIEVSMLAEQSKSAKPTVVVDYRSPSTLAGRYVEIPVEESANSLDQWRTHGSRYDVTVWGKLPTEPWSIDITVSFTGKFSYEYRP